MSCQLLHYVSIFELCIFFTRCLVSMSAMFLLVTLFMGQHFNLIASKENNHEIRQTRDRELLWYLALLNLRKPYKLVKLFLAR